jgi:hypothetical protein
MLPILVLCFARKDTLQKVIESILAQPHGPIYISCDGPTQTYERGCAEVREYVRNLLRLKVIKDLRISEVNEGCLTGVSRGIDWFFTKEALGIIIEDDLVLEPRLLEAAETSSKFLADGSVVSIGLHNLVPGEFISDGNTIARRSRFVISWGWVTTREQWSNRITAFSDVNFWSLYAKMVKLIGPSSASYHLWFYLLQRKHEKMDARRCSWDDLWQINCFVKDKTVAVLNRNQLTNIGNGEGSTHTYGKSLYAEIIPISDAEFSSSDFCALPSHIDSLADAFFMRNRKISTILKSKIRIRTRLGLK